MGTMYCTVMLLHASHYYVPTCTTLCHDAFFFKPKKLHFPFPELYSIRTKNPHMAVLVLGNKTRAAQVRGPNYIQYYIQCSIQYCTHWPFLFEQALSRVGSFTPRAPR